MSEENKLKIPQGDYYIPDDMKWMRGSIIPHNPPSIETMGKAYLEALRATELSPKDRKDRPVARGVLDYFPDALLEIAHVSKVGNDQHNPGEEMHWAKEKSTDHADCIIRHLIERGTLDTDGLRHSAKVAWRALALLQIELDKEKEKK